MLGQRVHGVAVAVERIDERLGEHAVELHGVHGARVLLGSLERMERRVRVAVHDIEVRRALARVLVAAAADDLDLLQLARFHVSKLTIAHAMDHDR